MDKDKNQHEITRLCLTGKGIICGLDICVDEDFGVNVRAGNGITSNGDYLEVMKSKWYRFYKPYEDTQYPLFEDVEIWELTEDTADEPLKPQSSEEDLNPFLRDKVVLLFKEKPVVEPEIVITSIQKDKTTTPVRVLLMRQQDVLEKLNLTKISTQILWQQQGDDEDFIYNDNYNPDDTRPRIHTLNLAQNPALRLPELNLRRFGFSAGDPFDCPPEGVDTSEFPRINNLEDLYQAYCPIIDEATSALDKALNQLHKDFGPLLDACQKKEYQEWIDLLCEKWEAFKRENEDPTIIGKKYYIQYFYDWVRDLIQAYNELRTEIINLVIACCGNTDAFPQHLFLGIALRDDLAQLPQPLRHTFQQPPIYNGNADRLQRLRFYCWRVLMMIKGFYLPDYTQDEKLNPFCPANIQDEEDIPDFSRIKVIPSRCYDNPLGTQSIPFYYPVTWSRFSVHHFWNYERTKTSSIDRLISYHASDFDDSYTQLPSVIRPLHYNLDNYPFFRIEGHIGQRLNDICNYRKIIDEATGSSSQELYFESGVIAQLMHLKRKYNLPFSIRIADIKELVNTRGKEFVHEFPDGIAQELLEHPAEQYSSFDADWLGMEAIAGSKSGGTIVIVYQQVPITLLDSTGNDEESMVNIAIADFYLPCCYDDREEIQKIAVKKIDVRDLGAASMMSMATSKKKRKIAAASTKSMTKTEAKTTAHQTLLDKIGKATTDQGDDLKLIKGIVKESEEQLNELGIYTFEQVSKMTEKEYEIVEELVGGVKGKGKRYNWASQASDRLKTTK